MFKSENIYNGRRHIGIQMNQKELTKTFMMISILKKPFGLQGFHRKIQRFKG